MSLSSSRRISNKNSSTRAQGAIAAGLFALVVGLGVSTTASAGHYLIADVPDVIAAQHHAALQKAGFTDTKQLYEAIAARKSRRAVAKRSGIGLATLTGWAHFLDLMQVNGIGPKMVRLLSAAGVKTLRAFRKSNAAALHARMKAVNAGGKYSEIVPSAGVIAGWLQLANKIPLRLE